MDPYQLASIGPRSLKRESLVDIGKGRKSYQVVTREQTKTLLKHTQVQIGQGIRG